MNITGSLVELPNWDDYYEPKEGIFNDLDSQDMASHPIPETVYSSAPETTLIPLSRAERIHNTALKSKAIRALYEQAVATPTLFTPFGGPWTIRFSNAVEFGACCYPISREIEIRSNSSDEEAISSYVFELTNAISSNKHLASIWKAFCGTFGCEEFVKQTEFIEFKGCQLHHKLISEAIKEMNWSNKMDMYRSIDSMDFATYWERIKNTPHANSYRKDWKWIYVSKKLLEVALLYEIIFCSKQLYNHFSNKYLSRT